MSTIVNKIEDLKAHAVTNYNFSWDVIRPVVKKVERKHIKPVLGRSMYKDFADNTQEDIKAEVLDLIKEASVNLALLSYSKIGMIDISNKGFTITSSQYTQPPEWWKVRDLRRELLNTAMGAIDEALDIMEGNIDIFKEWKDSKGYTIFFELFVRKSSTFNRYYNINDSRLTFLHIRPYLLKVEDKYFESLLGKETMQNIKNAKCKESKEALRIAQAAQVSLCIAEITKEGSFVFSEDCMRVHTDEIPGEKNQRSPGRLRALELQKSQAGNEYLKKLVKHLRKHKEVFPAFVDKEKNNIPDPIYNANSILSL